MLVMLVLMKFWRQTCWVLHWSPPNIAICKLHSELFLYLKILESDTFLCMCMCLGRSVKTSSYQNIRMLTLWGAATARLQRSGSVCRRQPRAVTSTVWFSCTLRGQSWASRCRHTSRYTFTNLQVYTGLNGYTEAQRVSLLFLQCETQSSERPIYSPLIFYIDSLLYKCNTFVYSMSCLDCVFITSVCVISFCTASMLYCLNGNKRFYLSYLCKQEKGETALHLAVLLADRTSLHILDFLAQNWSACSYVSLYCVCVLYTWLCLSVCFCFSLAPM